MREIKQFSMVAIGTISLIVLGCSCRQPIREDDALDLVRAFDNELIVLFNGISQTRSFELLQEILLTENVPLPFYAHASEKPGDAKTFNFGSHKGVYRFDSLINQFVNLKPSDSIILYYPSKSGNSTGATLVLSNFREEKSSGNLMIPTLLKGSFSIDEKIVAEIVHTVEVKHQWPVAINFYARVEGFVLKVRLSGRLRKNISRALFEADLARDGNPKFSGKLRARLAFSDEGSLQPHSLRARISAFPVILRANVNNAAIDKYSRHFVEDLNKHCRIEVFRQRDKRKIGDIRLKQKSKSDKLDYAFYYDDSSYVFLEEELIVFREIMNIKK